MFWVLMGLATATATSISDATGKYVLKRDNPYFFAWLQAMLLVPFAIPVVWYFGVGWLPIEFWQVLMVMMPFEIASYILYLKAIKSSPLSLTVPFLSFTPVLTLFFAFLILKEIPSLSGIIGVVLVTLGAYTLNIGALPKGFWGPIQAAKREKGSLYMIQAALIFGLTSTLARRAVLLSNPFIFPALYVLSLAILFTIYAWLRHREELSPSRPIQWKFYLFLVPINLLNHLTFNLGMMMTKAAYLISLKRMSLIMGVLAGKYVFHETHIRERLIGALLMFLGVLLIILG